MSIKGPTGTPSIFTLKQTATLYRLGNAEAAAKTFTSADEPTRNAVYGRLWEVMGQPSIPNFGLNAFKKECPLPVDLVPSILQKTEAIELHLSERYKSLDSIAALKLNQQLGEFLALLKKDTKKEELLTAFKKLDKEIQNTLCLYVWLAWNRPNGDPEFGLHKIEENPRILLLIQDIEGRNIVEQMQRHFVAKARMERTIKEGEEFLTLLQEKPAKDKALLKAAFLELDPEAFHDPLCTAVWNLDGKPQRDNYGMDVICGDPSLLLLYKGKKLLHEHLEVLRKHSDFPLSKAQQLALLNPECAPHERQDASLSRVTRILPFGAQPYAGGVTVVTYEFVNVIAQGGLAGAIHGIAKGLSDRGNVVRVIMPKFDILPPNVTSALTEAPKYAFKDPAGKTHRVFRAMIDGLKCYFIEDDEHFTIGKNADGSPKPIYGPNPELSVRMIHYSSHVTDLAYQFRDRSPVVHLHDWHTALVPRIFKMRYAEAYAKGQTPTTLYTFHNNLRHNQGMFDSESMMNALHTIGLKKEKTNAWVEGIWNADMSSTVSPTFAQFDTQEPSYGMGVDSIVRKAAFLGKFVGIVNGNNPHAFNPTTDPTLKTWTDPLTALRASLTFDAAKDEDLMAKKLLIKTQLQNWFLLNRPEALDLVTKPLVLFIGRYDSSQKGLELFEAIMMETLERGGQFVAIGIDPDAQAKTYLEALEKRIPVVGGTKTGACILIDDKLPNGKRRYQQEEGLGSLLRGAADFTVVPSKIEACPLIPLEANSFGSMVIASRIVGLADIVVSEGPNKTGFFFERLGWEDDKWNTPAQKKLAADAVKAALVFWKGLTYIEKNARLKRIMDWATHSSWTETPDGSLPPIDQYRFVYAAALQRRGMRHILPLNPPLLK